MKILKSNATHGNIIGLYNKLPKFYKRLYIIYFVLIIAILGAVAVGVTMHQNNDDEYDAFVDKTMQTEKFKRETDVIFDTAEVIVNLISEYDITDRYAAAKTDEYSQLDFEMMYDIITMMSKIQTSFAAYNMNIAMTKFSDNLVISGSGAMDNADTFFRESGLDINKAVSQMVAMPENVEHKLLEADELTDRITVLYRRKLGGANTVYYFLFFSRDDMLYRYDKNANCHLIFSNYNQSGANELVERITRDGELKQIDYTESVNGAMSFYAGEEKDGERIVYVKSFTDKSRNILLIMLPWFVIFAAAAAVLAALLTKFSYNPMRGVFGKLGIIGSENTDEFAVLGEMVDTMMENNRAMHISIQRKDKILKNRFAMDFLNGHIWGDKLRGLAEENGAGFILGECWLVLIKTDSLSAEDDFALNSIDRADSKIFSYIEERLSDYDNTLVCAAMERRIVLISDRTQNDIDQLLREIDTVRGETGMGIYLAIGSANGADGEIPKLYRKLSRGLDSKSLTGMKEIITEEDIGTLANSRLIYSAETETMLTEYVINGEKAKALYCLSNIFKANSEAAADDISDFKLTMVITVKRILAKLNVSEREIFGEQFEVTDEITAAKTYDELFSAAKDMLQIISDYVCDSIDTNAVTMGSDILNYINENIGTDISVGDVSAHFGISPSTIGRILRTKYNVTFKAYIDNERIKKAKQIMDQDKNILIKDLAQMLGYNNVVSFIRMFKKSEGVSPGQYIKMH